MPTATATPRSQVVRAHAVLALRASHVLCFCPSELPRQVPLAQNLSSVCVSPNQGCQHGPTRICPYVLCASRLITSFVAQSQGCQSVGASDKAIHPRVRKIVLANARKGVINFVTPGGEGGIGNSIFPSPSPSSGPSAKRHVPRAPPARRASCARTSCARWSSGTGGCSPRLRGEPQTTHSLCTAERGV